jgi:hypothetical protein
MGEDTWETEEQPILEAVRAGEVAGEFIHSTSAGAHFRPDHRLVKEIIG